MARSVRTIPATINKFSEIPLMSNAKRKVAAYARVSTDHEEQLTSYEAQVDYYTHYIKSKDDWDFVDMYTDEGISGTSTAKREGFNRMIDDALAGKIDLIITKSVSRFARNTVDSLTTIRKLKEKKIECYFEKENIWTFDSKGELLLTIMSSLAQEESRSISENVTWGHRKRFSDGKVLIAFGRFLGYDRGPDGNLIVNQEQAKIVKLIYKLFIGGHSPYTIAKKLTEMCIPSPGGKKKWSDNSVKSILSNEKYKGDALLQKSFTTDFLTKKIKKNEGEVPQYYVEHNHEAIIEPEIFDLVQTELKKRAANKGSYSGIGPLGSKIKCGECGSWYGSKVWHSNDKYRKVVYRCNRKYKNTRICTTPHVTENEIKDAYIKAVNKYLYEQDELFENVDAMIRVESDTDELNDELAKASAEMNVLADKLHKFISRNSDNSMGQTEFNNKFYDMKSKYDACGKKVEELTNAITDRQSKAGRLIQFLKTMKGVGEILTEFDDESWNELVDYVTVMSDKRLVFRFFDGTEITIE